jgi:hypothetical protein
MKKVLGFLVSVRQRLFDKKEMIYPFSSVESEKRQNRDKNKSSG